MSTCSNPVVPQPLRSATSISNNQPAPSNAYRHCLCPQQAGGSSIGHSGAIRKTKKTFVYAPGSSTVVPDAPMSVTSIQPALSYTYRHRKCVCPVSKELERLRPTLVGCKVPRVNPTLHPTRINPNSRSNHLGVVKGLTRVGVDVYRDDIITRVNPGLTRS